MGILFFKCTPQHAPCGLLLLSVLPRNLICVPRISLEAATRPVALDVIFPHNNLMAASLAANRYEFVPVSAPARFPQNCQKFIHCQLLCRVPQLREILLFLVEAHPRVVVRCAPPRRRCSGTRAAGDSPHSRCSFAPLVWCSLRIQLRCVAHVSVQLAIPVTSGSILL